MWLKLTATWFRQDAAARAAEIFFREKKADWITFTSSSTVKNLRRNCRPRGPAGDSHCIDRPGDFPRSARMA